MVYIIDDWDDGLLSGRPVALTVINGSLFAKGEFLKAKRPEWTVNSGSPSVVNGNLHLPDGSVTLQEAQTNLGVVPTAWEFKAMVESTATSGHTYTTIWYQDASNLWAVSKFIADGFTVNTARLRKLQGGSGTNVIVGTKQNVGAWHTCKVIRDPSSATWELIINNVSQGTAVDGFSPATNYIQIGNTYNGYAEWEYYIVY